MAQRDYEEQPEAPDLGASIQLDNADTLAGPPGDGDALDAGYVPADRPYELDDDAVTGRGMRDGESLDDRLAREVPEDAGPADPDRAGRIGIADEGAALETGDATEGVDLGIDGGAASAEEAAVHRVDGDSRVDGERSVAGEPALADPEVDALVSGGAEAEGDGVEGDGLEARADAARDAARVLDADPS